MKKIFSSLSQILILFLFFSTLTNDANASSDENELAYQSSNDIENQYEETNESNQGKNTSENNLKKSKGLSKYFKGSKAANVKITRVKDDDSFSSDNVSDSTVNSNKTTETSTNSNETQNSGYTKLPNGKAYIGVTSYLSLRDEPFGKVLTRLYNNEEIVIVNRDGDWYEVETEKGSGWIYGKCVYDSPNTNTSSSTYNQTENEEEKEEVDDEDSNKSNGVYNYFTFTNPGDYKFILTSTSATSQQETKDTVSNNSSNSQQETKVSKNFTNSQQKTKVPKNSTSKQKTKVSKNSSKKKSTDNDKSSSKTKTATSNTNTNTNLKPLLKLSKVNVSTVLTKKIGSTWDEKGHNYTHVQGFCTDGKYWYVALMTSTNGDGQYYTKQETKLLKINIKTKKVVKTNKIGKVGHSNSLTYNPNTKKIYSATCTKKMSYIYSFNASDLKGKTKIELKNKKGKTITNKNFASFSYNPAQNEYIVKLSNTSFGYFDSNFKLKKKVACKHMKKNDKMTGQAITCDGCNIFSVYNNLSCTPRINYIRCYDMNGKYIKDLTFKSSIGTSSEKPEMEQLTCYNGEYWSLSNVNGKFRIHKIKLRG